MRSIFKGLFVAAALATLAAAPVRAGTVPLTDGGGWTQFDFGGFGPNFQDAGGNTLDFTFTLTKTNVLRIADGGFDGDQFDVTINGSDAGFTTPTVFDGADVEYGTFTDDHECFSCAFFDPTYNTVFSHGEYILGPGTYDITGSAVLDPLFAGVAGIALGAVPEPATWAMMLTGFFGLGAVLRRSRRQLALA